MTDARVVDALVAEVEDTLAAEGYVGLHDFSWSLRGMNGPLTEAEIPAICEAAYAELRRRHELRLVWLTWPVVVGAAGREATDTDVLDFDPPDDDVSVPFLALVPRAH